ncbi:hypothetical protein [Rhodococcus marinonascens]|uniref:hypothetical protein n=1 Tax=Rhodococcus marinonascens TaxID=38311 RepID=UPI0009335730|nr:hypothetical protein [Rhodococcus marinonascens]
MIHIRRTLVAVAFATVPILGVLGAMPVANAVPVDPNTGPGKGCPIVEDDEDGTTTVVGYANPGDRIGVLVCGEDGEWTFGRTGGANNGPSKIQNQQQQQQRATR